MKEPWRGLVKQAYGGLVMQPERGACARRAGGERGGTAVEAVGGAEAVGEVGGAEAIGEAGGAEAIGEAGGAEAGPGRPGSTEAAGGAGSTEAGLLGAEVGRAEVREL